MTVVHRTTTLARPPKAFEVDSSWYESYWYDRPQSEPRQPSSRFVQALVWAMAFVAGAYFAI